MKNISCNSWNYKELLVIGLMLVLLFVGVKDLSDRQRDVIVSTDGSYHTNNFIKRPLVALETQRDYPQISGSFFLGIGSIQTTGGELEYYFMIENQNGTEIRHASVLKGRVIEDGKNYVVMYDATDGFRLNVTNSNTIGFYEFHIPKGAIIKNFKVDLE